MDHNQSQFRQSRNANFPWYEYVILGLTLLISLSIGIYNAMSGSKGNTTKDYLMAKKQLGLIPVALSMFMAFISAITVLGNAAEMYTFGIQQLYFYLGNIIACGLTSLLWVTLFYPLDITSSFEYLEMRFHSKAVKLTGNGLSVLSQVLYMAITMYAPAQALQSVTPIPQWATIVALGIICTVYTSIGGVRAVVWTEFSFDPLVRGSLWAAVVSGVNVGLTMGGIGQSAVQRYCAIRNMRQAKMAPAINIPLILVVSSLTGLCGITVFAYYDFKGCDILRTGDISNPNQILPFFILNVLMVPTLPGLFVAATFSASLSSISSSMNGLCACTWKDLVEPYIPKISEVKQAAVLRLLSVTYGCISVGVAFLLGNAPGNLIQISYALLGGAQGPLLGLFCLGALFSFTNWIGAISATIIGFALNLVVVLGSTFNRPYRQYLNISTSSCSSLGYHDIKPALTDPENVFVLFKLSPMLFGTLGTMSTIVIGLLVSATANCIAGKSIRREVHPALVIPVFDHLAYCFPAKWLRKCWCGIAFDTVKLDKDGTLISPTLHRPGVKEDDSVNDLDETGEPPALEEQGRCEQEVIVKTSLIKEKELNEQIESQEL